MKHKKTIIIPVHTRIVTEFETCDLCSNKLKEGDFEVNQVEVCHKKGVNYPESGRGVETTFDICGNCFEQKMVPWLVSQGAKPQIEKWDW
jgi:hypothetical protein